MINISNLSLENSYLVPSNQVYYVEELCKPYIESLNKVYITIAIFNLFYSFSWLWLKNRKDKIIFKFPIEDHTFIFTVGHIAMMLDIVFFLLNFFVFGYWLLLNNTEFVLNLPFIGWFT